MAVRITLPYHLRNLAKVGEEVQVDITGPVTVRSVLDALETAYPVLRGTIRDHDTLARKLHELDTERIACRGAPPPFTGSGDAFLYARCGVVARGRAFFEAVVADPAQFPVDGDLEDLLTIAHVDRARHPYRPVESCPGR